MSKRMRAAALLAILAVLLGVIVVMVVRGDPLPTELLAPLGVITAFLVWAEKESPGRGGDSGTSGHERGRASEQPAEDTERDA